MLVLMYENIPIFLILTSNVRMSMQDLSADAQLNSNVVLKSDDSIRMEFSLYLYDSCCNYLKALNLKV